MNEKQRELIGRITSDICEESERLAHLSVCADQDGKVDYAYILGPITLLELKTLVDCLEAFEAAADA